MRTQAKDLKEALVAGKERMQRDKTALYVDYCVRGCVCVGVFVCVSVGVCKIMLVWMCFASKWTRYL